MCIEYSMMWMHHNLLNHFSIGVHLLQLFAAGKFTVNNLVQALLYPGFYFYGVDSRSGIAGSKDKCFLFE